MHESVCTYVCNARSCCRCARLLRAACNTQTIKLRYLFWTNSKANNPLFADTVTTAGSDRKPSSSASKKVYRKHFRLWFLSSNDIPIAYISIFHKGSMASHQWLQRPFPRYLRPQAHKIELRSQNEVAFPMLALPVRLLIQSANHSCITRICFSWPSPPPSQAVKIPWSQQMDKAESRCGV